METLKQLSVRISEARSALGIVRDLAGTHGRVRTVADRSEAENLELAARWARRAAYLSLELERVLNERREELLAREEVA